MKITPDFHELIRYGIVGISNTLLSLLVIYGLMLLKVNYLQANIVGYIVGLCNSFYWNRRWVFRSKSKRIFNQILLFLVIFMVSYMLQVGTLYVFVNNFSLNEYVAQLLSMIIYTLSNFLMNKQFTFKY